MRRLLLIVVAVGCLGAMVALPVLAAGTRTVRIRNASFAPRTLTIARGTVVRWRWTGGLPHNVTVRRGPTRFHSRTRSAPYSFRYRFRRRGTYTLVCTVHGFTMKVRVR
jgi:plastocyanin